MTSTPTQALPTDSASKLPLDCRAFYQVTTQRLTFLALLSLVFTLAACGGSSSGTGTPIPGSVAVRESSSAVSGGVEDAFAASMLMTRGDVPNDYLEKKKTSDDTATLADACGRATQPGMTGRAVGDDFLFDGQSPAVAEVVTVFASEREATASVDAAQAYVVCALAAIDAGRLDGSGAKFSQAKSELASIDSGGDQSYSVQVQATKMIQGQSAPAVMQYTLVFARKGRVVYELSSRGSGEPLDPEDMSAFAQNAAARVRQR